MENYYQKLTEVTDFIKKSPSQYHVVDNIRKILLANDFTECFEDSLWNIAKGKNYFVTRNDSSIIAFRIPEGDIADFKIIASHSDAPTFKIKANPEILKEKHYITLNTEKYGGAVIGPWFDRPLSVAGRVMVKLGDKLQCRLVNIDRDLLMIPSLAIHMDRDANEGHKISVQKEIQPIWGDEQAEGTFAETIAEAAGVQAEEIIDYDLALYSRMEPSVWGKNREFFSSSRLDDLMCVYSSVDALISDVNNDSLCMCCVFDNEEVGSLSRQGADSDFLEVTMGRIRECLGLSYEEYQIAVSKSFMLSADNGHAAHPNYSDKADLTNRPFMNGGVLLKYSANQKYTTDSYSGAVVKLICKNNDIPLQEYFNNSDIAGGSTLGNISNGHLSVHTADIGVAQLAMHSPYETAGVKDNYYLNQFMKAFYCSKI